MERGLFWYLAMIEEKCRKFARGKYPSSVSQEVSSKNERDSHSHETDVVKEIPFTL